MDPSPRGASSPFLIPEVMEEILSHCTDFEDLASCFDVCQLWRSLAPPHLLRTRISRPPILISGELNDSTGFSYLASIRRHPSFQATKFLFRNSDWRTGNVQEFLEINGPQIEQLELDYYNDNLQHVDEYHRSAAGISLILQVRVPNLKTLIIRQMGAAEFRHVSWFGNTKLLEISNLEIWASYKQESILTAQTHRKNCAQSYSEEFLRKLIQVSPKLDSISIRDEIDWQQPNVERPHNTTLIIRSLMDVGRLRNLTALSIDRVGEEGLELLDQALGPGQLRCLSIGLVHAREGEGYRTLSFYPRLLEQILAAQASSLVFLRIPPHQFQTPLIIPPMPQLIQLVYAQVYQEVDLIRASVVGRRGSLSYMDNFPKLRVLGLGGNLGTIRRADILNEFNPADACLSVQVIHEIPHRVDQALMARIGQLFPNLSILHTAIQIENEMMLCSIWKFCPNIVELCLTLNLTGRRRCGRDYPPSIGNLDSIFSGILRSNCEQSRELSENKWLFLTEETQDLKTVASVRDLKNLRRLVIHGRDTGGNDDALDSIGVPRQDKLSNVFGYTTLAALHQLDLFQIQNELAEFSLSCIEYVCRKTRLEPDNRRRRRAEHELDRDPVTGCTILTRLGVMGLENICIAAASTFPFDSHV